MVRDTKPWVARCQRILPPVMLVVFALLLVLGNNRAESPGPESVGSPAVIAASVATEIRAGCDLAIDQMMEDLDVANRELLNTMSQADGLGPRDPFVEVDGESIFINDADACTDRSGVNSVYLAMEDDLGFSSAVLARIVTTQSTDGELQAESEFWVASWSDDLTNGQDIVITAKPTAGPPGG